METPPGVAPTPPQQSPPGQAGNLARNLAAKHGGQSSGPGKSAPASVRKPGTPGRRDAETEVSAYLSARGLQAVPIQAPGDSGVSPATPSYLVTPEFVGDVVKTLAEGVEAFDVRKTFIAVRDMCGDANLAKELAESAAAPPGCIKTMSKGFEELARKYPAILAWGAEGTIIACLGAWLAKRSMCMSKISELAEGLKKQAQAKATETSTAAPKP